MSDCCSCQYINFYLHRVFVQNHRKSCKAFAVLKAISLRSAFPLSLHAKQTPLDDGSVHTGEIQPRLFDLLLLTFKAGKLQGTNFAQTRKTNLPHTRFPWLFPLLLTKRKKTTQQPRFLRIYHRASRKHVILMVSSNLQMARCNQHI